MNILKKIIFILLMLVSLLTLSCSKQLHFSGVSENNVNLLKEDYLNKKYTKGDVIKFIGEPNIKEKSDNLWIYRLTKSKGNSTFKKTIYNKTLKLEFSDNILRSVEEVNLN